MKFTFKTRDEYFAYKADWKIRYFENIKEIRRLKKEMKAASQAWSLASKGQNYFDVDKSTRDLHSAVEKARYAVNASKEIAGQLLSERWESKYEAGRQREANLQKAA